MRNFLKGMFIVWLMVTAVSLSHALAPEGYYKRQGVGTYGVNNEKITCPNCGRTIGKYDSHMCPKQGGSSSSSRSGGSSSGGTASEADMRALEAKYPDMQINNTSYTPVDFNQVQSEYESSSQHDSYSSSNDYQQGGGYSPSSHKKSGGFMKKWLGIIRWVAIFTIVWKLLKYAMKRLRAKREVQSERPVVAPDRATAAKPSIKTTPVKNPSPAKSRPRTPSGDPHVEKTLQSIGKLADTVKGFGARAGEAADRFKKSDTMQSAKARVQQGMNVASEKVKENSQKVRTKVQEYAAAKSAARTKSVTSIADEIQKLDNLRRSGAISEQEYQQLKNRLLH